MREPRSMMSWRRTVINLIGFAVGLGLFVWIVVRAVEKGGWDHLAHASPWLIIALIGSSLLSALVNGATFWVTVRPIKKIGFVDLQLLNLVANLLNLAPLRLGVIARVGYHLRVDRLRVLQVGAWFSLIAYVLALGVGSCLVATMILDELNWMWLGLVLVQMVMGALMLRVALSYPFLARYTQGIDQVVNDPVSLWGAVVLRLADLTLYTARMAAALAILDMHMPAAQIVVLAVVALAASLVPFGRLGFREFCVALAASQLSMLRVEVNDTVELLALVDSTGEMIVYIVLGAPALLWFRQKWRNASPDNDT